MEPIRIQRKRIKGWTMPENTVYVGRPTKWGNPYSISAGRSHSLKFYRIWLEEKLEEDPHFLDDLKDKNLACWCKLSQPCHVDVLLEKLKSSAPAKPLHSLSEGETSSDRISDGLKSGISPVSPSKETGGRTTKFVDIKDMPNYNATVTNHTESITVRECIVENDKPKCRVHGSMNKVTKEGIWRCLTCGVGCFEYKKEDK